MPDYPRVDESFARLHQAGWSIGEIGAGGVWIVTGTNGENRISCSGMFSGRSVVSSDVASRGSGNAPALKEAMGQQLCARHLEFFHTYKKAVD